LIINFSILPFWTKASKAPAGPFAYFIVYMIYIAKARIENCNNPVPAMNRTGNWNQFLLIFEAWLKIIKSAAIVKGDKKMKPKPDDRSDNVERIQENINHTIENMRKAEEMIEETSDETMRRNLIAKNENREEALKGMRREIREEAIARENGYKA
jgi:small acid-soluble spore protein (thioredoxin-like protein)